jgi:Flp pilus assembly protein TadD
MKLLGEAFERSGQYRFKQRIGDVKMRQYNRKLRALRQEFQQQPDNAELRHQMEHHLGEQLRFELAEYAERAKNYPTDMGIRFELGVRELRAKDFDSAIAHLQEAQSDPSHRANALRFLGEAFTGKEWFDEAIDTLRRGIEGHPIADDALGTGLRYDLGRALQAKATRESDAEAAKEALSVISNIAQLDINYRDVRQRVETLRQLIAELQ